MSNKENSKYEDTFYIVPRYIRKLCGKNLAYIDVYEALFQFWNKGRPCFLSNDALAERADCKMRQVQNALEFFEKHGHLRREQRGLKRFLTRPESRIETDFDQPCTPLHPCAEVSQPCTPVHGGVQSSAPQPCNPVHPEYKEVNIKKLTTTGFESFWSLYPKKKAKKACEQKWKALKLDNHIEQILEKLQQQKENDDQWLRGYIPDPLTYLNQARWEDEIQQGKENQEVVKKEEAKKKAEEAHRIRLKAQEELARTRDLSKPSEETVKQITVDSPPKKLSEMVKAYAEQQEKTKGRK